MPFKNCRLSWAGLAQRPRSGGRSGEIIAHSALLRSPRANPELIKSELAPSGQYETAYFRIFKAGADLASWASEPKARAEIDQELAAKGYDASFILAQAYMRGAAEIEAIDKRIAFHEQRRSAALKDAGIWSDRLLRRLDQAMPGVIEGEFTEAVEQD